MMLLTFRMLTRGNMPTEREHLIAPAVTFFFLNLLFFFMLRTGETDRFRSILFVTLSVCLVVSFIPHHIEVRGSMAISRANTIEGKTPFWHIMSAMTLIPAALAKMIIFPSTIMGSHTSFDLSAVDNRATYDKIKYWISKERLVGLKAEFYTVSGKMFKTATFEYENSITVDGKPREFISKMVITSAIIKEDVTTMGYRKASIKKVPDSIFNLNLLMR
jgi:hypothetical protein